MELESGIHPAVFNIYLDGIKLVEQQICVLSAGTIAVWIWFFEHLSLCVLTLFIKFKESFVTYPTKKHDLSR